MPRLRYLLSRAAAALVVVVATTALTHAMLRLLRPDVFRGDEGPLVPSVLEFLGDVFLERDLGLAPSESNLPVVQVIVQGLPADVSLLAGAIALGVIGGATGGIVAASRPRTLVARAIETAMAFALIAPVYWVGLMLILVFAPGVGGPLEFAAFSEPGTYQPLTRDPVAWLRSLLVPWIVLALPIAALVMRMMRGSMAEVLDAEYLRTARAKGISERAVLRRHALPAAASPVATVVGIYFATFASNALLVEQVFGVPGALRLTLRAAAIGDFQLLQGLVVVTAALVVLGTFLADAAAGFLDPRVRSGGAALRLWR